MILYDGPSLIDGTPIFVAAAEDENPKTGRMLFTYILRQDRPPQVAAYDGSDSAICGDCKFRAAQVPTFRMEETDYPPGFRNAWETPNTETRRCYVRLSPEEGADEAIPPSEIWRKWRVGEFQGPYGHVQGDWETDSMMKRYRGPLPIRIASYGDPAAVPLRVWAELVRYSKHWTGYTHLWKTCDPELKRYAMASVDTIEERDEAQALGWRTFLVVPEGSLLFLGDILCPATDPHVRSRQLERGRPPVTCSTCMLCRGTSAAAPSIYEIVHGKNKEKFTW